MRFLHLLLSILPLLITSQTDSRSDLIAKEPFGYAFKLPEEFTTERMEMLIQHLVDKIYNVGFRYLGVEEDLFHGHVLFTMDKLTDAGRLYPFAILYHTQEEAKAAHWGDKLDKKFDYLNVQTRNWLQWLEQDRNPDIENARLYLDEQQKDPKLFFEQTTPIKGQAFTIHARNLSEAKLGYNVVGEMQFEFYRYDCADQPVLGLYTRGPITVTKPDGEVVCMVLSTRSAFIDWELWRK